MGIQGVAVFRNLNEDGLGHWIDNAPPATYATQETEIDRSVISSTRHMASIWFAIVVGGYLPLIDIVRMVSQEQIRSSESLRGDVSCLCEAMLRSSGLNPVH